MPAGSFFLLLLLLLLLLHRPEFLQQVIDQLMIDTTNSEHWLKQMFSWLC